jgi:hypothetical protein
VNLLFFLAVPPPLSGVGSPFSKYLDPPLVYTKISLVNHEVSLSYFADLKKDNKNIHGV